MVKELSKMKSDMEHANDPGSEEDDVLMQHVADVIGNTSDFGESEDEVVHKRRKVRKLEDDSD